MPISLPTDPNGEQYEDLVISALLIMGYFVESNMILNQDGKQILELDVVATPLAGTEKDRVLFEVKKENFNFTNTFKLYGQRLYLGIDTACLVSMRGASEDHLPIYETKGEELGISMRSFPIKGSALTNISDEKNSLPLNTKEKITPALWYLNIARRIALAELQKQCKIHREVEAYKNARQYLFSTRASFFQKSALERAEVLYKAYLDNPRLSGSLVSNIANRRSEEEESIWTCVRDTHEYLDAQSVMDLESMARFGILKNAFDDFITRGDAPPPLLQIKLGDMSFDMPKHNLPKSYYEGLELLKSHKHGSRIPYLFQVFYSVFGGYLFYEMQDELRLISAFTDIPEDEVLGCLDFLTVFFGDFFWKNKYKMLCMKSVPAFVRGGGSFARQNAFDIEDYKEKYGDASWLLSKWHNAIYYVLDPHLRQYA